MEGKKQLLGAWEILQEGCTYICIVQLIALTLLRAVFPQFSPDFAWAFRWMGRGV